MRKTVNNIRQRIRQMLGLERDIITKPESLENYVPGSVLVVAPHSDDEVLGCGGFLEHLRNQGARLNFMIVTDGRAGTAFTDLRGQDLCQARKQETLKAAELLGVENCLFLDQEDTRVSNSDSFRHAIRQGLDETAPDLILLPYIYDAHTDHRVTAEAVLQLQVHCTHAPKILMYEVWTPLPANRVIAFEWEEKASLIKQYRTQLGEAAFYLDGARSLARYRSMTTLNDPCGHAECFLDWQIKS